MAAATTHPSEAEGAIALSARGIRKVFDGKAGKLTALTSVLIVGNKIDKIGNDITAPQRATVIDSGGHASDQLRGDDAC